MALERWGKNDFVSTAAVTNEADEEEEEDERQPVTNTYVRYLFDTQLFNVPNNQEQCNFLLTYLNYERIYDVSYVVYNGPIVDNRVRGNGLRFKNHQWKNCAQSGQQKRARRHEDNNFDENLEELMIKSRQREADPSLPMFNTKANTKIKQPITRKDIRDLLQSIRLNNEEDDWLDLKVQLCLPSILLYFKLQGSATKVPNADYTVEISMRELQLLNSAETLGHKLATVVAYVRHRFFNNAVPNMDKLYLLNESDTYDDQQQQQRQQSLKRSSPKCLGISRNVAAGSIVSATRTIVPETIYVEPSDGSDEEEDASLPPTTTRYYDGAAIEEIRPILDGFSY